MTDKDPKSFQPSRFASLRDTCPQPVTWEALAEEIRGETHAVTTRLYRDTCARLVEAEAAGDEQTANELKLWKSRLKTAQPAFICSVTLTDGRTAAHIRDYSGFVFVDLDGIDPARFAPALAAVKEDPHTVLAYVTLSGAGIRVVARVKGIANGQDFRRAWQMVNDRYAELTGISPDAQCKNATRMSALCHDPAVVYHPEARFLTLPAAEKKPAGTKHRVRAEQAAPTVLRLVEDDGIGYRPGSRNAYVSRCLYWMNRFGVPRADARSWAMTEFADYEAEEHNLTATVNSCYALTDEHGSCRLRQYERRKGTATAPAAPGTRRVSIEEMEAFIPTWGELRMNRLIHQIEVSLCEETDRWQRLTDTLENSLWRTMQHAGLEVDIFRLRTLLQSDFVRDYHPLEEYLAALPPWDGVTDYIGTLSAMVHCRHTPPERFDFYFRRWLVGMLAAALDEQVVNHVILVLLGPQGSFKSSFMENLLPPTLRRYYTSKTNSYRLSKDDLFTMTENLLVNFEEIDSMLRPELNQLKAMTTTLYVNERPAYGRNKVRLPHVASFCATGNNLEFLTDDTGNRRWLPFEVERIENPWMAEIPYEGIYAQAKALLDNGFRYWFQEREVEELNARNRRFETPNPARELILTYYRSPQKNERGIYVTPSQIVARFGGSIRLNVVKVGLVLKELGFEQVRTRHGRFWLVVERKAEEINSILPEALIEEPEEIESV